MSEYKIELGCREKLEGVVVDNKGTLSDFGFSAGGNDLEDFLQVSYRLPGSYEGACHYAFHDVREALKIKEFMIKDYNKNTHLLKIIELDAIGNGHRPYVKIDVSKIDNPQE